MVAGMVRDRLGRSEPGRAALRRVAINPNNAAPVDELRTALRTILTNDPVFTQQLLTLLDSTPSPLEPPSITAGSVVLGDSNRLRKSQIILGPVTLSNSRNARALLVATAALLAALLGFGIYIGVQSVTTDDSPKLSNVETAQSILPNLQSLPPGWIQVDAPHAVVTKVADGQIFVGGAAYKPGGEPGSAVKFRIQGYSSIEKAATAYRGIKMHDVHTKMDNPPSVINDVLPLSMSSIDTESTAFKVSGMLSDATIITSYAVVRRGAMICIVSGIGNSYKEYPARTLELLTQMMSERVRQAQSGETPIANATHLGIP